MILSQYWQIDIYTIRNFMLSRHKRTLSSTVDCSRGQYPWSLSGRWLVYGHSFPTQQLTCYKLFFERSSSALFCSGPRREWRMWFKGCLGPSTALTNYPFSSAICLTDVSENCWDGMNPDMGPPDLLGGQPVSGQHLPQHQCHTRPLIYLAGKWLYCR